MRRITRRWLLISLTLGLFPALAYAEGDELRGVWKGSLGKQKIMACFDYDESASYYYLRYETPISLIKKPLEPQWEEMTDTKTATGIWTLTQVKNDELSGLWQKPGESNTLPIHLKHVPQTIPYDPDDARYRVCMSDTYYTREMQQKVIVGKRENFNGIPYRHLNLRGILNSGNVSTIELLVETPQAATVNKLLRKAFQEQIREYFADVLGIASCSYNSSVNIEFLDNNWLSIREDIFLNCGAYPMDSSNYQTFDLVHGKEVNLWTFFKNTPKKANASAKSTGHEELDKIALPEEGCEEAIEANDIYHPSALKKKGIGFCCSTTSIGHVPDACYEGIEVPYEKLLPFMTEQGKKVARRLMQHSSNGSN